MTMTANLRAPWTVGSTPPTLPLRLALPHLPSPYKGEENDGPSFLVPLLWAAPHSVNE